MNTVDVASIRRIDHREAMAITAVEMKKVAKLIADLDEADWGKPTDCARWTVHGIVAHIIGSAAAQATPREFVRQVRAGRPVVKEIGAEFWWDGMNEIHVRDRAGATPADLAAEWDVVAAKALRARTKLPRPIAKLPLLNLPAPVGRKPVGYLFDMGFTRDAWMHRIDVATATGRQFDADAEHDGRILADIVAEWAETHGEPFSLELTGPAGGSYTSGTGGEQVTVDAVQFARLLAGRGTGTGLLAHPLPL
jgi:uncharacterized protein (TIGR03083 family)